MQKHLYICLIKQKSTIVLTKNNFYNKNSAFKKLKIINKNYLKYIIYKNKLNN